MRLVESKFARNNQLTPKTPTDEPIYIVGFSQETAHGDTEETWQALLAGRPLVIKEMDSVNDPLLRNGRTRFHMPLISDPFARLHPGDRQERKYFSRVAAFDVVHARALLVQAGLLDNAGQKLNAGLLEPHLVSVMIGSGYGPIGSSIDVHNTLRTKGPGRIFPSDASKQFPEQPNAKVASMLGLEGATVLSNAAACASGTQGIVLAYESLRAANHLAIAGGVETVGDEKEDLMIGSFTSFPALSQQNESPANSSRPFDAERDGFVAASAVALLLLARASLVERLKITPYAEIVRGMYSNDGSVDVTKSIPHIQARELTRMLIDPKTGQIFAPDVIWAHATSTGLGDRAEINVYKTIFGDLITTQSDGENDPVIIYGPKAVLAHSMGASGASAGVTALQAMRDRVIPSMSNLKNPRAYANNEKMRKDFRPDPDIPEDFFADINFSRNGVMSLQHTPSILVGNQGFGSHNAYFLLKPV